MATGAATAGALQRFLGAHGLARRVASGRPFTASVGAPAAAPYRRLAGNVLALPGTYQLAVSRSGDGALVVGLLYGRRSDLRDATLLSSRALRSVEDVRTTCAELDRLTGASRPAGRPRPVPLRHLAPRA